jgi:ribonuclease BN (tRNA processing enzyme)
MKLTVIGCSGSYPGPDSPASCYLVQADGTSILLDLGSGSLGSLQRHLDPTGIDAVLFSHLHPDHWFDLSGLYVVWKYHPDGPRPQIPVWGPAGVASRAASAYGLTDPAGMSREFDFHEYAGPLRLGPFTITPTLMAHPVPAYALRVEQGGRVLSYSGDTGPCDQLAGFARDADLLLAEAAFVEGADNPPDLHLTGRDAGAAASAARAKRLVLTHIPPWHDKAVALGEAKLEYAGPVELATTGATYDV